MSEIKGEIDVNEKAGVKEIAKQLLKNSKYLADWTTSEVLVGLKYLKKHKKEKRRQLLNELLSNREIKVDPKFVEEVLHWFDLVDGTYANTDEELLKLTDFPWKDFIEVNRKSSLQKPAFFLALDHSKKAIVLGVRGTKALTDALTDLYVHTESFENGEVHSGMYKASQWFVNTYESKFRELLNMYKGYCVRIIGHSLGAGTASLITLQLSEKMKDVDLHCFAFAPPACISEELIKSERNLKYITSIILGADCVPRGGPFTVQKLREELNEFDWKSAALEDIHKMKLVKAADKAKSAFQKKKEALKDSKKGQSIIKKASKMKIGFKNVVKAAKDSNAAKKASSMMTAVKNKAKGKGEQAELEEEEKDEHHDTPLFPPGKIYHILKCDKDGEYGCTNRSGLEFNEIDLADGMLEDHLLDSYGKALKYFLKK